MRFATRASIAVAAVVLLGCAGVAQGRDVWFLGVGNDGYDVDTQGVFGALSARWTATGDTVHSRLFTNHDGPQIETDLAWLAGNAGPGDLAVFYYSGHGDYENEDNGDEMAGWAMDSFDETIGTLAGSWSRDDEITAALMGINPGATLLTVFDSCYSGGFVGGTQDLNALPRVLFLAACTEIELAEGGSPFSVLTEQLIEAAGPSLPADTNSDGIMTFYEWVTYADGRITGQTTTPYVGFAGGGDYPIIIPEPATIGLIVAGLAGLVARRRRRK